MISHHATALNLASVLEHAARQIPDRVAITCGAARLTFGAVDAEATKVAAGLHGLGIAPGDHVALSCPNLPWFPIAYFGILKAGAVVVPLNVLLKPREIAYHLKDSQAKAYLAFEGTNELPLGAMARAGCDQAECLNLVVMTADPAAPSPIPGALTLAELMKGGVASSFDTRRRRPDDTAVILYTSGTTGQPKGAELTHENMLLNAVATRDMYLPAMRGGYAQDVALVTLPLFHSTAQTCLMNAGFLGGFRLVLMPRFDPAAALDIMRREDVGFWIGVPTMYWALLQHAKTGTVDTGAVAAHMRLCVSGGAAMPLEVMRGFEATFSVRIMEGYGLSETSPVACFNQLHQPTKPGTVGQPIFGVEVRCVDGDDRFVPSGQPGEIVIRGPNVMKGYFNRPEATEEAMRHGWFHTGDIGTLDAEGYLTIVDRKKDMIIRGGFNVYPREIEEVMLMHPAIAQVAVVGIPDERLGEEVKAFVVRRADAHVSDSDLIDWCREQMAAYMYPRSIEFREALPISPTGKVVKRELKPHTSAGC
ncbi:MAG: long-chain-fatty-acid--CoA ligase [Vicinamibacterales bacterium]